jgi:RNA polymerase sigma factor (TIGR02999 family)
MRGRRVREVTQILGEIDRGEGGAAERLLPLIYQELRQLAAARMAAEKPGQTLDATSLVHEAYLRLVGDNGDGNGDTSGEGGAAALRWDSRGHFFAAAAEAMRRILVDNARRKHRPKHGGGRRRVELEPATLTAPERADDLLALDEVLDRFAAEDPAKAEVVKLRYFAGLSIEQTALALHISPATAKRHWAYARAWLHAALAVGNE